MEVEIETKTRVNDLEISVDIIKETKLYVPTHTLSSVYFSICVSIM